MESNLSSQILTSFGKGIVLRHDMSFAAKKLHLTFNKNGGPVCALHNMNKSDFISLKKGFCGAI